MYLELWCVVLLLCAELHEMFKLKRVLNTNSGVHQMLCHFWE
jgi:hypothetical protein